MCPDHPFVHPDQHPWNSPLAPFDPVAPPPDWALHQFGPVPPPRPEDFPFTPDGRREYYRAAELAAMQSQVLMQQQQAFAAHAASAGGPSAGTVRAAKEQTHLLLLRR